jgi:hypothetical protein
MSRQRAVILIAAIGLPFVVLAACIPVVIVLSKLSTSAANMLGITAVPLSAVVGVMCAIRGARANRFAIAVIYVPLMIVLLSIVAVYAGILFFGDSL